MKRLLFAGIAALALAVYAPAAFAHPHVAEPAHQGEGQDLANSQNHGPFSSAGVTLTSQGDPAAYGLETAHHGPDSGTPGKADGAYQVDSMPPGTDDQNPAIG
jgi:hypothetical protein